MKLTGKTTLRITVDPHTFLNAGQSPDGWVYIFNRLFSGLDEVETQNLDVWGISIEIADDDEYIGIPRIE